METFWKQIHEMYVENTKTLDSNINFLSCLGINENNHTKLLEALLSYKKNGEFPFLKSFLSNLSPDLPMNETWKISTQDNYIDCLIQGEKSAIIIENKVCGAQDQNGQISNYVDSLKKKAYSIENIYVLYLTLFGGEPSQKSLPDELRKSLQGRFISVTYEYDILQWLEQDVLPICPYREQSLINSLKLYINYLKKMIGIVDPQQIQFAKDVIALLKKNNLSNYASIQAERDKMLSEKALNKEDAIEAEEKVTVLTIVLRQMENDNVYCSDLNVAENLKRLMRNKPLPAYKYSWTKKDYSPFNLITRFTWDKVKHVQLLSKATPSTPIIKIHIKCTPAGIKNGPYVILENEVINTLWDMNILKANGFEENKNGLNLSRPFENFTETTPLTDVANFIWKTIQLLNTARNK